MNHQNETSMKKSLAASPFIMLIIPVVLFLGLSLAVTEEKTEEETLSTTTVVNTNALVKAGKVSLVQYLLK